MGLFSRVKTTLVGEILHEPIADGAFPGLIVTTGRPYVVEGSSGGRIELWEAERTVKVGATEGTLQPPKGFGRRRADNVSATVNGQTLALEHHRWKSARLLLDGQRVAALRGEKRGPTRRPNDRAVYAVKWVPGVAPEVAALGHALASRYGVGAPGLLIRALLELGSGM